MNYHDARSPNTSSHNPRAGPSRRPATISELAERASIPWDNSKGLKYHLKLAEKYQLEGKKYARSGDMENAFVELAKAATLVLESLPEHPDYNAKLNANQRHNLGLVCPFLNPIKRPFQFTCLLIQRSLLQSAQEILDNLNELKPGIVDRYENWCQAQLDGVDGDITLNVPTQQLANVRFKRPFQFIC